MSRPCLALEGPFETAELDASRYEAVVRTELASVWRVLRRLGLGEAEADDAAQQVFLLLARRLVGVEAGRERAFLFASAVRVAAGARRKRERRLEFPASEAIDALPTALPDPEQLLEQRHARAVLDAVLAELSFDLRLVFVLFEIEGLDTGEIATLLGVPTGTVASRLRRAREDFARRAARYRTRVERGVR